MRVRFQILAVKRRRYGSDVDERSCCFVTRKEDFMLLGSREEVELSLFNACFMRLCTLYAILGLMKIS